MRRQDDNTCRIILLGLLVYTFPMIKAGALYTGKRVVAPAEGAPAWTAA